MAGVYDAVMTAYQNAEVWARKDAYVQLFKGYDEQWMPKLMDLFPKTQALHDNGDPVYYNEQIAMGYFTDPQTMSQVMDMEDIPPKRNVEAGREFIAPRLIKEWGPTEKQEVFESQFIAGYLNQKRQKLITNAFRSMSRFGEYTLSRYVYADTNVMSVYGNQYDVQGGRLKTFNALETNTSASDYLIGQNLDNLSTVNLNDFIDTVDKHLKVMSGRKLARIYGGTNTISAIRRNKDYKDTTKYVVNRMAEPLSMTFLGITFDEVIGQTYKVASADSNRIGYPGLGNTNFDTWTSRVKQPMMTHTVGSTEYEWLLAVPGELGNTYTAKTSKFHEDTNVPYAKSWEDLRTEEVHSELRFASTPYVNDMGEYIIIKGACERKV